MIGNPKYYIGKTILDRYSYSRYNTSEFNGEFLTYYI
jgi:hypothetical protein